MWSSDGGLPVTVSIVAKKTQSAQDPRTRFVQTISATYSQDVESVNREWRHTRRWSKCFSRPDSWLSRLHPILQFGSASAPKRRSLCFRVTPDDPAHANRRLEVPAVFGRVEPVTRGVSLLELEREGVRCSHSLLASIVIACIRFIEEVARVFNSDLVSLLRHICTVTLLQDFPGDAHCDCVRCFED